MFFENMKSAAVQVSILYIIVVAGYLCDRAKIYTEKTARATIDLLLHIVVPCMLVTSFIEMEMTSDTVMKFFISLAVAFATHFIAIGLNLPFFRKKNELNPVFKFASIYGNVGYMALPLANAVLGSEGVFYCASGVIAFNVLTFTHGAKIMAGDKFKFNIKSLILNPGVISVIIGLPIFLLQVNVPQIIAKPLDLVGSLNTPLAMLIFGTYLANTDLKKMFFEKRIYLVALLKLIVLPFICIGIYRLCGITGTLLVSSAITASVPCANNTFMFASKYSRDTGVASKTVALVSFISIITMPVVIAAAQTLGTA
ncbi:MAG: AEC family transporter [Faecalibacterium sp.]|nr:AEC family transporter [Ruminococcus sp.]MCM1392028.1 AEC family transporter [Ruminococcus sp.]MCM1484835.1 AEC family transporter [Faecalibacterium sp.]